MRGAWKPLDATALVPSPEVLDLILEVPALNVVLPEKVVDLRHGLLLRIGCLLSGPAELRLHPPEPLPLVGIHCVRVRALTLAV